MIDSLYAIAAIIVAGLLVYVMQKTEHDRINRIDPVSIQWLRRLAFTGGALVLLASIRSTDWQLTSLMLVCASGAILAVNAAALNMRWPPPHIGTRQRNLTSGRFAFISRIVHYFSSPPR